MHPAMTELLVADRHNRLLAEAAWRRNYRQARRREKGRLTAIRVLGPALALSAVRRRSQLRPARAA